MLKKSVSLAAKLYYRLKNGFNNAVLSFLDSKAVTHFAAKYPKVYTFLLHRFLLDEFIQLPLTLLLLSFIANLFLLDEIVEAFVQNPIIAAVDASFARLMFSMRTEWIAKLFYYFTMFGSFWGVVSIAIISTVIFIVTKHKTYLLPVWIALLGTQFTVGMSEELFSPPVRPIDFLYYPETTFSFSKRTCYGIGSFLWGTVLCDYPFPQEVCLQIQMDYCRYRVYGATRDLAVCIYVCII